MKIVEKILIALLVILLPVGIFVTNYIIKNNIPLNENVQIDAQKLKVMVDKYGELESEARKPRKQFVVSNVSYASKSGELTIMGTAPSTNMTVMMSATVLPNTEKETSEEGVLGTFIGNYSVLVSKNGSFSVSLPINNPLSVVEVRLEQEEVVRTIRYDFDKNLQTL